MKKLTLAGTTLTALLLAPLGHAATTLAVMDFSFSHELPSPATAANALSIRFSYSMQPGGLTDVDSLIFDALSFDGSAAGAVHTLTDNADDANYSNFLGYLLSPAIDDIRVDVIGNQGGGIGIVGPESSLLRTAQGAPFSGLPANSLISALQLSISQIDIDPSASSGAFNWAVTGQLRVLGEVAPVPLPGAAPLFGAAALLTLAVSARRHRARPVPFEHS